MLLCSILIGGLVLASDHDDQASIVFPKSIDGQRPKFNFGGLSKVVKDTQPKPVPVSLRRFRAEDMEPANSGPTVTFIRHAQSLHNVCQANLHTRDNALTPMGVTQCEKARKGEAGRLVDQADLVIVSPLRRALQTATLLSGDREDAKFFVTPLCTERRGELCDEGSPPQELIGTFPYIAEQAISGYQFSNLDENWWPTASENEPKRARDFLRFLLDRPEEKIVVVSHGDFLSWMHESLPFGHPARLGRYMHNAEALIVSKRDLRAVDLELAEEARSLKWSASWRDSNEWWRKNEAEVPEVEATGINLAQTKTPPRCYDFCVSN